MPSALRIGRLRLSSTPPSSKASAIPPTMPLPIQSTGSDKAGEALPLLLSVASSERRPYSAMGVAQNRAAVRHDTTPAAKVPASDLRFANGGEGSGGVRAPKRRPKTDAAVSAHDSLNRGWRDARWGAQVSTKRWRLSAHSNSVRTS